MAAAILAGDWSFTGWSAGMAAGVAVCVALNILAYRLERRSGIEETAPCPCLLRMAGLMALAFGAGIGYLVARAYGG